VAWVENRLISAQMRPDSPLYSPVNKLLLKSPSLALDSLSLFLPSLSSADAAHCRARRLWVLRLLQGAALSRPLAVDDSRILRRQFIPDLLLSLAASALADAATRDHVVAVMALLARHWNAARCLAADNGVLAWLASALLRANKALPPIAVAASAGGGGGALSFHGLGLGLRWLGWFSLRRGCARSHLTQEREGGRDGGFGRR